MLRGEGAGEGAEGGVTPAEAALLGCPAALAQRLLAGSLGTNAVGAEAAPPASMFSYLQFALKISLL